MSERTRNLLALALMALLASSAFVAGYFTNDFVELQLDRGTLVRERRPFDLFWEAWGKVEGNFLGELPSTKQMTYGAIRGAFTAIDDPYTVFIEPAVREQERQTLQGSFGGIGAYLRRPEDNGEILLEPIPGNPAEIAGILFNDVLLAVDGVDITPEMSVADVANLIKGEKGTTVVLTVRHAETAETKDIEIRRDDILIPSVSYRLLQEDESIGYIQLTRFSGRSGEEVREAILDLQDQGAEKLILDMRNNPGGLLDAAVEVSDHFLSGGTILYQESKGEGERVFEASEDAVAADLPLLVLVNEGTASAAEILAGALQDRERAIIIGAHSFGKGSVQLVFDLSDGSSVHVTSARWFTPNRQPIDSQGVQPDIPVTITQEAVDNGRDEVLARAVTYFQDGS